MIASYVPELRGTAWEDATLRRLMNTETGLSYTENFEGRNSGIWEYR